MATELLDSAEFRIVAPPLNILGEGPTWDVENGRLYWVDSTGGAVLSCDADGSGISYWKMPARTGSVIIRRDGNAIVTLESGVYLLDLSTGELSLVVDPEPDLPTRMNDAKVDRQGRLVTGTMDLRLMSESTTWLRDRIAGTAALYQLDADLKLVPLGVSIGVSNGPCFSPDGSILYVADSWSDEILAFDYDSEAHTTSNRRVLVDFQSDKGHNGQARPDGATVDSEGYLWSAACNAGEVRRYAPDGELDRRVRLPTLKVTSLAFGGSDLDILYLTSKRDLSVPMVDAAAGSLFALHGLGVTGIPETRFAG